MGSPISATAKKGQVLVMDAGNTDKDETWRASLRARRQCHTPKAMNPGPIAHWARCTGLHRVSLLTRAASVQIH